MPPIRRAHPFTPGAMALALMIWALVIPGASNAAILYALATALALAVGEWRAVRGALLIMLPIWALLFVLQGIYGPGVRVTAPWGGGSTLSQSGLQWMLSQGSRLGTITTASLAFAAGFDPHRFLQAAVARRWPFGPAFLLVATLDAAKRLGEQARRLREAQRVRGIRVRGSVVTRARAFPALVFPLLLTILTEADDRALALETRGLLLSTRRVAVTPPRDSRGDRVARGLAFASIVVVIWWRISTP